MSEAGAESDTRVDVDVTVRSELPGDVSAIREVLTASFPSTAEAKLVEALREAGHLSVSLVACVGGRVVGHVAFSPVVAGADQRGVGLAPLAVEPAMRRAGIGSALVRAGLAACEERGWRWVVVLGDPRYYSRFGFEPASQFGLADEYGGGSAFQVRELAPGGVPQGAGLVRYGREFAVVSDFVGQGEFPETLDDVNWVAALFTLLWMFFYGMWDWVGWLLALVIVPFVIENAVILLVGGEYLARTRVVLGYVTDPIWVAASVWAGLAANRMLWEREHRRFEAAGGDLQRPIPLQSYLHSLRFWTRLGLGLAAFGLLTGAWLAVAHPGSVSVDPWGLARTVVPIALLFAVQQVKRSRRRRAAPHSERAVS